MVILVISLSFLIGITYLVFIRLFDRYEKESLVKLIIAFIAGGILSVLITTVLYSGVAVEETFRDAILKVGTIEELSKMAGFLIIFLLFRKSINEIVDGLVYISAVALGFACIENVFYALGSQVPVSLLLQRSVFAVAGHVSFAGYMGIALFIHFKRRRNLIGIILSFILAALAHGLYDAVLFEARLNELFHYLFILIIVAHVFLFRTVMSFSRFKPVVNEDFFERSAEKEQLYCVSCERTKEITPLRFNKIRAYECDSCKSLNFDFTNWLRINNYFRPLINSKRYGRFLNSEYSGRGIIEMVPGSNILFDTDKKIIATRKDSLRIWINTHNHMDQAYVFSIPILGILLKYLGLRHLFNQDTM